MRKKFAFLFVLLGLVVLLCPLKVKPNVTTVSHSNNSQNLNITENSKVNGNIPNLDSNITEANKVNKEKEQVGSGSNMKVVNAIHEGNLSGKNEPKKPSNVQEEKGEPNKELKKKEEKVSDTVGAKQVPEEAVNKEDIISSKPHKEEVSHGEECDLSNKCTDEQNKLVACLRVPGNESPHLSLLIQNKGKKPLTVTISAPHYVQLDKTTVQLQGKENKKVKVTMRNGGTDSVMVLRAGDGNCSLDFRDLVMQGSMEELKSYPNSSYINLFTRRPAIAFVSISALILIASAWICISFRRRQLSNNVVKYQMLDMELPVSTRAKELATDDGWDNNWDDGWNDEEAPHTPTMPVTPSISSKGLAPRRLAKEDWKD